EEAHQWHKHYWKWDKYDVLDTKFFFQEVNGCEHCLLKFAHSLDELSRCCVNKFFGINLASYYRGKAAQNELFIKFPVVAIFKLLQELVNLIYQVELI